MIDQWFKKDLDTIFKQHSVAVFIDESGDGQFLLKTLGDEYSIYEAHSELKELHVKYLLEKEQPPYVNIIYTTTPREKLKFVREYCETNGCIDIRYFTELYQRKGPSNPELEHQSAPRRVNCSCENECWQRSYLLDGSEP